MDKLIMLEKRLEAIERRNEKVEKDKAWETSLCRVMTITVSTYFLIVLLMYMVGLPYPFVNAVVPATGYFLSMRSLSFMKKWWIRKND